jgi:hypothetical protein
MNQDKQGLFGYHNRRRNARKKLYPPGKDPVTGGSRVRCGRLPPKPYGPKNTGPTTPKIRILLCILRLLWPILFLATEGTKGTRNGAVVALCD